MTKWPSMFFAALLALPAGSASAQDDQRKGVPCVGPMCMLTPIWKLGTMMPGTPEESKPQPTALTPQTPKIYGDQTVAPAQAVDPHENANSSTTEITSQTDVSKKVDDNELGPPTAATVNFTKSATVDRRAAKRTVRLGHHFISRFHRFAARSTRTASHVVPPASANGSVTVAANGTEFDRLLRLASVVSAPPIKVIPAVSFVDGCRRKPADFVVDTMSNPNRVGPAIPLFTESLIIVARKDIKDFASLHGHQVSFGLLNSASHRVANRVFHSLAIDVHEQPLDFENAFDALTLGDLDAVALLAPRGFNRLAHHDPSFHLLALPAGFSPPDGLKLSRIEPSTYLGGTWSTSHLGVVTVDAVLSPSRTAQMPLNAQSVYAALDRHSSQLAANGFDLIGGNGGLTTMRSSAEDPVPPMPQGAGCER